MHVIIIDLLERERGRGIGNVETFCTVPELRSYTKRGNLLNNRLEMTDGNLMLRGLLCKVYL